MLSAIDGLQKATISKSFADHQDDWLLRRGVERGIEIISEASRTIPTVMQALRPEIPWPRVRAIGNVLRHEYHNLADEVLWNVVIDELPRLKTAFWRSLQLRRMLDYVKPSRTHRFGYLRHAGRHSPLHRARQGAPGAWHASCHRHLRNAYAPHDLVFPRCAAIVHHAGMGTAAQALLSGRPQLAVPFFGDQPDIEARLFRLGAAERISSIAYTSATAASALSRLLAKPRDACATVAIAVRAEQGAERLADKMVALTD